MSTIIVVIIECKDNKEKNSSSFAYLGFLLAIFRFHKLTKKEKLKNERLLHGP